MAPLTLNRKPRLAALLALAATLSCVLAAAVAQPTETAVKAAFLPRFARYVTWPPAAAPKGGEAFVLCVLGSDPFGANLDNAARSQSVDGRRVVVRRLDGPASADGCHIAFVQGSRTQSSEQMLAALGRRPVLTITDGAVARRGMIHFTLVAGRVRFFIDEASAEQRGLVISSRLLALAVSVKQ